MICLQVVNIGELRKLITHRSELGIDVSIGKSESPSKENHTWVRHEWGRREKRRSVIGWQLVRFHSLWNSLQDRSRSQSWLSSTPKSKLFTQRPCALVVAEEKRRCNGVHLLVTVPLESRQSSGQCVCVCVVRHMETRNENEKKKSDSNRCWTIK